MENKKHYKRHNLTLVCKMAFILLNLSHIAFAENAPTDNTSIKAVLWGRTKSDSIELMWQLEQWSPRISGFVVKKRRIDKDRQTEWIAIHEKTILIGCTKDKNMSYITDNDQAIIKYNKLKDKLITSKQLMSREQIEHAFEQSKSIKGMLGELRRYLKEDLDRAKLMGFSLIDNFKVPVGEQYEYGLFILENNKDVSNEPDAIYRTQTIPDKDLYRVSKFTSKQSRFGIRLSWHFTKDQHAALAGSGFNLYRKSSDSNDNYVLVKKVGGVTLADESWKYFDYDKDADVTQAFEYMVKPISLFDGEIDAPSFGKYVPNP